MSKIVVGKSGGKEISIDRKILMATRLLITADSGGGKTWLIKRLVEQAFGKVGIIVIDPEGEFSPLRTKFDFFLIGKGGDVPANIRTADKVARTLLEGRASAICDIYDMPDSQRHIWVQRFLHALLNAPKELRHPYFVIVDESQMFCPEHGKGDSVATDEMRGLAGRGRKRLLCGIFATQRLALVSKDLTGMCLNRLVGPSFETANQTCAADVLGVPKTKKERAQFFTDVKMLEPGNFYALGRAITKELKLVQVGPIETPHGQEALRYELKPPPPTSKVRAWLKEIGDLPEQAEEEATTIAGLQKQLREALSKLRKPGTSTVVNKALPAVNDKAPLKGAMPKALRALLEQAMKIIVKVNAVGFEDSAMNPEEIQEALKAAVKEVARLAKGKIEKRSSEFEILKKETTRLHRNMDKFLKGEDVSVDVTVNRQKPFSVRSYARPENTAEERHSKIVANGEGGALTNTQLRVLRALNEFDAIGVKEPTRGMVASWLGVKAGTGSFKNYLSELRVRGLIISHGSDQLSLTPEGKDAAPEVKSVANAEELLNRSASVLGGTTAKVLRIVHREYPNFISREDVAAELGVSSETGSFKNYISELRVAGMIMDGPNKTIQCAPWLREIA